jgi:hypothetical protein
MQQQRREPPKTYTATMLTGLGVFAFLMPAVGLPVLGAVVAISGALAVDDLVHQRRVTYQQRQAWALELQLQALKDEHRRVSSSVVEIKELMAARSTLPELTPGKKTD